MSTPKRLPVAAGETLVDARKLARLVRDVTGLRGSAVVVADDANGTHVVWVNLHPTLARSVKALIDAEINRMSPLIGRVVNRVDEAPPADVN